MPCAFRDYPCSMKQSEKAITLILFASLLSGCSGSPEPADKAQAKTECEIATEKSSELIKKVEADVKSNGREYAKVALLNWAFYTIEKKECFSSEIIAQAQTAIALVKN